MIGRRFEVYKTLGDSLETREAAMAFLDGISKLDENSKVHLDFLSVDFMSRAFADQFIKGQINLFKQKKISTVLFNLSDDIQNLLETVSKSQGLRKTTREVPPVINISDWSSLNKHLISI